MHTQTKPLFGYRYVVYEIEIVECDERTFNWERALVDIKENGNQVCERHVDQGKVAIATIGPFDDLNAPSPCT